jgi:regulator of extracellular matrix RemA (YlzA/DUF370 family)
MGPWIDVGQGGVVNLNRVVAVARYKSLPVRRLLDAIGPEKMIDLTAGRAKRSVILLDNGYVAVVHTAPQMLLARFREVGHEATTAKG